MVQTTMFPFSILLSPNIRLRILFSFTLSMLSSLNVRDHVSKPYSTMEISFLIYFNFHNLREKSRRQKCLDLIIARISCFISTFYFLVDRISIVNKEPKYERFSHFNITLHKRTHFKLRTLELKALRWAGH